MTEAALFYETARIGFGDIFLDDIQRATPYRLNYDLESDEVCHLPQE